MRSKVRTIGRLCGRSVKLGSFVCIVSTGSAAANSSAAGEQHGELRPVERGPQDRAPHPALAARPVHERHAPAVDAVAELVQERRQHRDRADHREEDDDDRRERPST